MFALIQSRIWSKILSHNLIIQRKSNWDVLALMHIDWISEFKDFSYLLFFLNKSWLSPLDVLFLLNETWFFEALTHNRCHLVVKIILIEFPEFDSVCLSFNLMYLLYLLVHWLIKYHRLLGIKVFILLHHFLNCLFIELEIDVISCDHNT